MIIYVLIKNYGYEGQQVRGVTTSLREATTWYAAGDYTDFVECDTEAAPDFLSTFEEKRTKQTTKGDK